MQKKRVIILILVSLLSSLTAGYAQRAAVSTDLLRWGTLSPNASIEMLLGQRVTLNVEGSFNPFEVEICGANFKHASISPEVRYWFQRPLYSHFIGVNTLYTYYDVSLNSQLYKGRMVAMGITYGYGFILGRRWALIPTIGVGCGYVNDSLNSSSKFTPTITKLGVGFSYIIN